MTHVENGRVNVFSSFKLYRVFMRRKRALSEAIQAFPTAPTLKEYMWEELRKLFREHGQFTSEMSIKTKKKFR